MNVKALKTAIGYYSLKDELKLWQYRRKAAAYIRRMPFIYHEIETLERVAEQQLSIARFGDGEIGLCLGGSIGFQNYDQLLARRLRDILKDGSLSSLLVCLSPHDKSCYQTTPRVQMFVYKYLARHGEEYLNLLDPARKYGSTFVSRPDSFVFEGDQMNRYKMLLRNLWANRDVLIVTGEKSRFVLIDELFDNIRSVEFLYGPSQNAFSSYDELLSRIRSRAEHRLVLLALGPTATVLAYDLAKEGRQTLDIGHLPSCFKIVTGQDRPVKIGY